MSWSVSYESKENFTNDVRSPGSSGIDTAEAAEQLTAARGVAIHLMESGVLGAKDGDYCVYLNGHANPEHRPAPGWANDCVGVNVSQKT